ncbi:MAG TPA: FtsQ-type POTRA domain-containing protein [Vicinamibacteria bacterium]
MKGTPRQLELDPTGRRERRREARRLLEDVRRARADRDEPVEAGDQPFLRSSRRTRVRRARRGLTGRVVLGLQLAGGAAVLLTLLWGGYARVMASERLRVTRLEVRGGRFLSEGEVRDLLGPAVGENILSLDIASLTARLKASPWVAEASIVRTLPDTLRVEVREREPLAVAEVERLYLMGADGTLIDVYGPRTAGFDLPIVRGLGSASVEVRRERGARLAALLADLGALGAVVSELEVEPGGDIRVVLRGGGEVLRLGEPPYRPALETFLGLRSQLARRCPDAEYFDLRFRDRIYVKRGAAPAGAGTEPAPRALPAPAPPAPALPATAPRHPSDVGTGPNGGEVRPVRHQTEPGNG